MLNGLNLGYTLEFVQFCSVALVAQWLEHQTTMGCSNGASLSLGCAFFFFFSKSTLFFISFYYCNIVDITIININYYFRLSNKTLQQQQWLLLSSTLKLLLLSNSSSSTVRLNGRNRKPKYDFRVIGLSLKISF